MAKIYKTLFTIYKSFRKDYKKINRTGFPAEISTHAEELRTLWVTQSTAWHFRKIENIPQ